MYYLCAIVQLKDKSDTNSLCRSVIKSWICNLTYQHHQAEQPLLHAPPPPTVLLSPSSLMWLPLTLSFPSVGSNDATYCQEGFTIVFVFPYNRANTSTSQCVEPDCEDGLCHKPRGPQTIWVHLFEGSSDRMATQTNDWWLQRWMHSAGSTEQIREDHCFRYSEILWDPHTPANTS